VILVVYGKIDLSQLNRAEIIALLDKNAGSFIWNYKPDSRFPKTPCWATLNIDADHGRPGLYAAYKNKELTIYHSDYTSKGSVPARRDAIDETRGL
jgi:hypothetical protein